MAYLTFDEIMQEGIFRAGKLFYPLAVKERGHWDEGAAFGGYDFGGESSREF